jgi:aryl carrier-like protein
VKVRGFRIELGEIEGALLAQPDVRAAAATVRVRGDEKRLVAYVVGTASPESLKLALGRVLPEYMVPSSFVVLDALPLTTSGKVDRKALPEVELGPTSVYAPAETTRQEELVRLWQDVLRIDRIGIDDNYFELGGDSLRSVQVVARARAQGLRLEVRDLFMHQTVRALAAVVREPAPERPADADVSGLSTAQLQSLRARLRKRTGTRGEP